MAVCIRCSVDRLGSSSSGCQSATCATRRCRACVSLSQLSMLSPSFFMASQMMLMSCCLSASWMGLLSMVSSPIRFSRCITTHPCLLSQLMLSRWVQDRALASTGAARKTLPVADGAEAEPEVLSDAMTNHL